MSACWRCDQIRAAVRDDPVLAPLTGELEEVITAVHHRKHEPAKDRS